MSTASVYNHINGTYTKTNFNYLEIIKTPKTEEDPPKEKKPVGRPKKVSVPKKEVEPPQQGIKPTGDCTWKEVITPSPQPMKIERSLLRTISGPKKVTVAEKPEIPFETMKSTISGLQKDIVKSVKKDKTQERVPKKKKKDTKDLIKSLLSTDFLKGAKSLLGDSPAKVKVKKVKEPSKSIFTLKDGAIVKDANIPPPAGSKVSVAHFGFPPAAMTVAVATDKKVKLKKIKAPEKIPLQE